MAAKASKGKKSTQRKLTAILSADVVGYSRLMGADEEATIETLTAYRKIFTSEIKKHRGRVVDAKGDAILAEFASVVDAVSSAVEIQRELAERNTELPGERRMDFRIGINLGDVVVKNDAIYGDGVNVAARLEALAEPGGICISRPVHDQVKAKLKLEYEYLGEQEVKNIAKPVRAYKVRLESGAKAPATETRGAPQSAASAAVSPARQSQPTIAVLPFVNMSGDTEQEYFSDGISEDLITALSNITRLSVVSRNSVFAYKGQSLNAKRIGEELGVSHIVEGSVRKGGDRVRITAQLIDAETDRHLWSERYDRTLEDVFAVQDDITQNIVTALNVTLLDGDQALRWRTYTDNPEAYYLLLRARSIMQQNMDRQSFVQGRRLLEQAVALDPNFSRAYSALAACNILMAGLNEAREQSIEHALELAKKAVGLDDSEAYGHCMLGGAYLYTGHFDEALAAAERALAIDPDGPETLYFYSRIQCWAGNLALAEDTIRKAIGSVPSPTANLQMQSGIVNFLAGRYEEAASILKTAIAIFPNYILPRLFLAAAYAAAERSGEATAESKEVLRIEPGFSLEERAPHLFHFRDEKNLERMKELLRKAGLPD